MAHQKLHLAKNLALPIEAITQKFAFLGRSGAGKTYGAGKFVEELLAAGAQVVILDPVGNWYGLRLAADGKTPGIAIPIFGGDHGDIPLVPTGGSLVADVIVDRGISVVLDVHHFRKHERKEFMTHFAEHLFHRKKSARSPMHVVIEEAQVFVPQKAFKGEERLLGAMEDLCKLGRNYGIGNTLISQRPQAVNKDVLNQTGTLFVFNMTGPQERKVMEGWIVEQGIDTTELVDELPALPNGTAYVWSPQWLHLLDKFKIGEKRTYDASATPVFGKVEKARSLAPVDLEQIQSAMQSTIEKAKADDPKELRKEILALKKEILALKQAQPVAKAERVEVSVLKDEDRKTLESIAGLITLFKSDLISMEKIADQIRTVCDKAAKGATTPPARREHHKNVISPAVSPRPTRAPRASAAEPQEGFDGTQQRTLDTIAMLNVRGIHVTREAVARWMGIHPNGGRYLSGLASLRANGYLDGWSLTAEGEAAARELPTGIDEAVAVLKDGTYRRSLEELIAVHPKALSREELAERMGIHPNGGRFLSGLAWLRQMGVISERSPIHVTDGAFQ